MPRYAAIDIGSNSVRMLAAEVQSNGKSETLAADREVTRLGASVFQAGFISRESQDFVAGVLRRFAGAYQKLELTGIRAVATAAVRDASNQREFLDRASEAAGVPIEIISGQEEARLIHLGVESRWPHSKQKLLIVDVGGGSAEIILSENGRLREAFSRPLGAVRLNGVFLTSDPPAELQLMQMHEFIEEKLAPVVKTLGVSPCDRAVATSSTAAAMVCAVNRIPRIRREEADRMRASASAVRKLYHDLCSMDISRRSKVPGIGPRRAEIIIPGVAVLLECMQRFKLPSFHYSTAGVREGIIADLAARRVGSELSRLSREQRVVAEKMAARFGVKLKHARIVAGFCHTLFEALQPLHKLKADWGKLLEAAAILYDTGHFISDTGHHKHAQYIVTNSDLPGYTDHERTLIALLCRFHRKSMPSVRHADFQGLSPEDKRSLQLLIPLLRLADALDLSKEQRIASMQCEISDSVVLIRLSGEGKFDLEEWAAERAGDIFEQVYGKSMAIIRTGA